MVISLKHMIRICGWFK